MSRRIVYLFAFAACATFAIPASADRECFDNMCRMPEVMEPPEAPAAAPQPVAPIPDETALAGGTATPTGATSTEKQPGVANNVAPQAAPAAAQAAAPPAAPQPVSPQMIVEQMTRSGLRPAPAHRPAAFESVPEKPSRFEAKRADAPSEPVEVVSHRYAAADPHAQVQVHHRSKPSKGVVVVVPGVQYGADGVGLAEGRQSAAWELCQQDRKRDGRCSPYDYQPYGAYGYRPLGSHRPQIVAPVSVYVPDAKIITLND